MTKEQEAVKQRVISRYPGCHSLIEIVGVICRQQGKTVEQILKDRK